MDDRTMQPPDEFQQAVHEVLVHLYDYPYLQLHPLGDILLSDVPPSRERMRLLRALILQAIEELSRVSQQSPDSARARRYEVLHLHLVEGLTIQSVAAELVMSERQVYRDLRRARDDLTLLLWSRHPGLPRATASDTSRASLVIQEAARLRTESSHLALDDVIGKAAAAVKRLAADRAIDLRCIVMAGNTSAFMSEQIVRQVLVSALSHAMQSAQRGRVTLAAQVLNRRVTFRLDFATTQPVSELLPRVTQELIRELGGGLALESSPIGRRCVSFWLPIGATRRVLIIDDNQGLIHLFGRYLTGQDYDVVTASTGGEGLALAVERQPDVIVLDVMMPDQDGWELLQQLKNLEVTRDIPVVVCSVFDDPGLAHSLGADAFLAKPVTRAQLLATLAQHQRGAPEG